VPQQKRPDCDADSVRSAIDCVVESLPLGAQLDTHSSVFLRVARVRFVERTPAPSPARAHRSLIDQRNAHRDQRA
jgi:hypothetical protein